MLIKKWVVFVQIEEKNVGLIEGQRFDNKPTNKEIEKVMERYNCSEACVRKMYVKKQNTDHNEIKNRLFEYESKGDFENAWKCYFAIYWYSWNEVEDWSTAYLKEMAREEHEKVQNNEETVYKGVNYTEEMANWIYE